MKKFGIFFGLLLTASVFGQFKDTDILKPGIREGMINTSDNFILGLINPANFSMKHSYSLSYSSFGCNGIALGVYTNSMMYKLADNLNIAVDASLVHSPYSSFGKNFQNDISGIFISRASVQYNPWKNFSVSLQYNRIPDYFYPGMYRYNPFYSPVDSQNFLPVSESDK